MKRILFIFSVIILTALQVTAGSLKATISNKNFLIARQIVINGKDINPEDYGLIRDIITKNGGTVLYKFSVKALVGPAISIKHANKIKGSNDRDAFQIDITQNSVKVTYTSSNSLTNAANALADLVRIDTNGNKCLKGGKYIWVSDPSDQYINGKASHMAGEIKVLISDLDKMAPGSETELVLITSTDWMMESRVLEEFDNGKSLYSAENGFATCDDLRQVLTKASARGVNLKIVMKLHEENLPFKETLGHSIFSPEGMRFLRAAFQEWHDKCGLNTIYTGQGNTDDMQMQRFNGFLDAISPLIGIKIIH